MTVYLTNYTDCLTRPVSVNHFHHLTDVTPVWKMSRAVTDYVQSVIMYHNPRQSLIMYHNPRQTLLDIMNSIQLEFKPPHPTPPSFFFSFWGVYTTGNTGLKCWLSTVFLSTCASTVGHQWGSLNIQYAGSDKGLPWSELCPLYCWNK